MGRKSMVRVRREEIIDAVQRCIMTHGMADTTMAKVAEEAGMKRSAISHFLGSRDAVIAAAVERSCDYYINLVEAIEADHEPQDVPLALVDKLIGGRDLDPAAMVLFDEILTLAHRDETARVQIHRAYGALEATLDRGLAARYPDAPARRRSDVARVLTLLIDNEERFRVLGLASDKEAGRATRVAAKALLESLEPAGQIPPND